MSDMMTFPKTVEEFMEIYKVVDTEGIYMSKGAELVPIFRMRQWFEHLPSADIAPVKHGRWQEEIGMIMCSECGDAWAIGQEEEVRSFNYCPNCGARMDGDENA